MKDKKTLEEKIKEAYTEEGKLKEGYLVTTRIEAGSDGKEEQTITKVVKKSSIKPKHTIKNFCIKTILLITAIWAIISFVIVPYRMSDNSMYPNVHDGDLGLYYKLEAISIDSVVLYKTDNGDLKVGRVVALGGHTIEFLESGGYNLNGYAALEKIPFETDGGELVDNPITLEEDEYFVLNDYRSNDDDSRTNGVIKKDQIVGTLLLVLRIRDF